MVKRIEGGDSGTKVDLARVCLTRNAEERSSVRALPNIRSTLHVCRRKASLFRDNLIKLLNLVVLVGIL